MKESTSPADVALQLAAVLEDNVNVSVPRVLEFELALYNHPTDRETCMVYRDWLLEQGCSRRAEELARHLDGEDVAEYTGPVRPETPTNWARL